MSTLRSFATSCRRRVTVPGILLAAAVLLLVSGIARAQQNYDEMSLNAANSTFSKVTLPSSSESTSAVNMLAGTDPFNKQAFDSFFKDLLFPTFTQYSDRMISGKMASPLVEGPPKGGPAKMRETFKGKYANVKGAAQVHEELNSVTLEFMDGVVNKNYHPVVRVNAMLMIADLNETDPNGAPWKKALPALLKAASDPKMIDGVRVEALRGLLRHAKSGIAPESRAQVTTAMLAIIDKHTPPAGGTQDGHNWICRRAIDVLTALGDAGPNGAVPQSLIAIINDPAASVSIRCAAAEALGMLKITPPKDADVTALAKNLGKLAIAAVNTELTAKAPMHGPITVERLKQDFLEISHGLTGENGKSGLLNWSTDATIQRFIGLIDAALKPLMQACDTKPWSQPIGSADRGTGPPVPIDTQSPIVDALNKAVESLKTILEHGEAPAATAPAPVGGAAGAKAPDFN
jgi:hypothetical protein